MESLTAALTNTGTREARRTGRVLLVLISVVNVSIFYTNVRSLLAYEEDVAHAGADFPYGGQRAGSVLDAYRSDGSGLSDLRPVGGLAAGGDSMPSSLSSFPRRLGGVGVGPDPLAAAAATVAASVPLTRVAGPSAEELYGHHRDVSQRPLDEFIRRRTPAPAAPADGTPGRDVPLVITHVDAARFAELRHLVGSLHHWHPELTVSVYVVGELPHRLSSELMLWRNVDVRSASDALKWLATSAPARLRKAGVAPEVAAAAQQRGALGALKAARGDADASAKVVGWGPIVTLHALETAVPREDAPSPQAAETTAAAVASTTVAAADSTGERTELDSSGELVGAPLLEDSADDASAPATGEAARVPTKAASLLDEGAHEDSARRHLLEDGLDLDAIMREAAAASGAPQPSIPQLTAATTTAAAATFRADAKPSAQPHPETKLRLGRVSALYMDPYVYVDGWIDNVLKYTLRDGFFFVEAGPATLSAMGASAFADKTGDSQDGRVAQLELSREAWIAANAAAMYGGSSSVAVPALVRGWNGTQPARQLFEKGENGAPPPADLLPKPLPCVSGLFGATEDSAFAKGPLVHHALCAAMGGVGCGGALKDKFGGSSEGLDAAAAAGGGAAAGPAVHPHVWFGLPPWQLPRVRCVASDAVRLRVHLPSLKQAKAAAAAAAAANSGAPAPASDQQQQQHRKDNEAGFDDIVGLPAGREPGASDPTNYDCRLALRRWPADATVPPDSRAPAPRVTFARPWSRAAEATAHGAIHVALAVPSTTAGTQVTSHSSLPLTNIFLPSFLATVDASPNALPFSEAGGRAPAGTPGATERYHYSLFVGYDMGDTVYGMQDKREVLGGRLAAMVGNRPVSVYLVEFPVSLSPTFVWNGLFAIASGQGRAEGGDAVQPAEYFFASHDDTEFYPSTNARPWVDILRASLAHNVLKSNFGIAGPLDVRSPKIISHGLVHVATHGAIFGGTYVPDGTANEDVDDWISRVYGYKNTFLHTGVTVYNTHRFTGRSRSCGTKTNDKEKEKAKKDERKVALDDAIARGGDKIRAWVYDQVEVSGGGDNGGGSAAHVELLLS